MIILAAFLLAIVCGLAIDGVARELRAQRRDAARLRLLALFGPAIVRAQDDPRQLLAWHPIATAARKTSPEAFADLDAAMGSRFPFTRDHAQAAHARWTADWLTWERHHDHEYKLKAAEAEEDLARRGEANSAVGRARVASIEREQLERYQQRYEEYVRVSKALAALEEELSVKR